MSNTSTAEDQPVSVPVRRGIFQALTAAPFRIEGELDRKAVTASEKVSDTK
jgi:hypothetical protein